jgi:hypothetical protein
MNIRNRMLSASVGLCLTLGMWTVAQVGARAAIILSSPHADFSAAPYTISFGGGAAAYTFTDVDEPSTDPLTVAAVSTGGSALVNAVLGQPIAFQLGTVVGATGYDFAPLPTPAGIPDSIAEDSIGLKFSLPDGIHYGFVTTLGPEVILDGYNTTPGGFYHCRRAGTRNVGHVDHWFRRIWRRGRREGGHYAETGATAR